MLKTVLASLVGLLSVSSAFAVDKTVVNDSPVFGNFTVNGGVDVTTDYIYQGYVRQNQGVIVQPSLTVGYPVVVEDYKLNLTPYIGGFTSIHGDHEDSVFNEVRGSAGVLARFQKATVDLNYTYFTYPDGYSDDTQQVGVTVSYDDTGLLPIALNPSVGLQYNFGGDRTDTNDSYYLQFGIEPKFDVKPVVVSIPVVLGTGFDNQYVNNDGSNEFLGFGSIGVKVAYPVTENVSLYGRVDYYHFFADSTENANNGDDNEVVGTVGVAFKF